MSRIEEALRAEAEDYARKALGWLYDQIPDSVKAEIEREYIAQRSAELGVAVRGAAPDIAKYLLVGGVILALMFMPRK